MLEVTRDDRGVVTLTMDRPEVRNAFGPELMAALRDAVGAAAADPGVRALVITGRGPVFSAGADLNWMRSLVDAPPETHEQDSRALHDLFATLDRVPVPVVARVNGHALGGATGLIACSDVAVAVRGARFGFTEVRLGLAPAVISTFVLPRIGTAPARRYFLTGEQFDAEEARRIGLVHEVCDPDALDAVVGAVLDALLAAAPGAQRATKQLIREVAAATDMDQAAAITIPLITRLRTGAEGQAGMRAFLDRQPPPWQR